MTNPAPKRGRGRPRLREGERTVELRVQVPESERADVQALADARGETLSDVVRGALAHYRRYLARGR